MTRFEYLSVLISIVLALGMTELVIGWARLLQRRAQVRFSVLHAFWSLFLLLLLIQFWWGFWNFRTIEHWSFGHLLAVVLEAILIVLCSILLTPERDFPDGLDLEAFWFASKRPFFIIASILLTTFNLTDIVLMGLAPAHPENGVRLMGIGVTVTGAISSSRRVHFALAGLAGLLLPLFLATALIL